MELIGLLKLKYDTQKVSDKFQKRDCVITTDFDTQYPQHVQMQFNQDKCGLLEALNVGDMVKVQFNVRGREWNGPQGIKYFNTLEGWRIEKVPSSSSDNNNSAATTETQTTNAAAEVSAPVFNSNATTNDDLPF